MFKNVAVGIIITTIIKQMNVVLCLYNTDNFINRFVALSQYLEFFPLKHQKAVYL